MNSKIRVGLIFGITIAVLLISEHLITTKIHTTNETVGIITIGILSGAIGGLVFGFLI
jgi:hypothetical protein